MAKQVTGRSRMIASVNGVTGRTDCSEAVLVQQRPAWLGVVLFPIAVIAFFVVTSADLGGALSGGIAGGIVGLLIGMSFVVLTKYLILARCSDDVLVLRSSKSSAKAVELLESHPTPVQTSWANALLSKKLTVNSNMYYVARQFVGRAKTIVG